MNWNVISKGNIFLSLSKKRSEQMKSFTFSGFRSPPNGPEDLIRTKTPQAIKDGMSASQITSRIESLTQGAASYLAETDLVTGTGNDNRGQALFGVAAEIELLQQALELHGQARIVVRPAPTNSSTGQPSGNQSNDGNIAAVMQQIRDVEARIQQAESENAGRAILDPLYKTLFDLDQKLNRLDGDGHPLAPDFIQKRRTSAVEALIGDLEEQSTAAYKRAEEAADRNDVNTYEHELLEANRAKKSAQGIRSKLDAGDTSVLDDYPVINMAVPKRTAKLSAEGVTFELSGVTDQDAAQAAERIKNKQASQADVEIVAQWVMKSFHAGLEHNIGAAAHTPNGQMGYCGLAQKMTTFSFMEIGAQVYPLGSDFLSFYTELRPQAFDLAHAFTFVTVDLADGSTVTLLFDPTLRQFHDVENGPQVMLDQTADGRRILKQIYRHGYVLLNNDQPLTYLGSYNNNIPPYNNINEFWSDANDDVKEQSLNNGFTEEENRIQAARGQNPATRQRSAQNPDIMYYTHYDDLGQAYQAGYRPSALHAAADPIPTPETNRSLIEHTPDQYYVEVDNKDPDRAQKAYKAYANFIDYVAKQSAADPDGFQSRLTDYEAAHKKIYSHYRHHQGNYLNDLSGKANAVFYSAEPPKPEGIDHVLHYRQALFEESVFAQDLMKKLRSIDAVLPGSGDFADDNIGYMSNRYQRRVTTLEADAQKKGISFPNYSTIPSPSTLPNKPSGPPSNAPEGYDRLTTRVASGEPIPFSFLPSRGLWLPGDIDPRVELAPVVGNRIIENRLISAFGDDRVGTVSYGRDAYGHAADVYLVRVGRDIPPSQVSESLGLSWNVVVPVTEESGYVVYELTSRDATRLLSASAPVAAIREGVASDESADVDAIRRYLIDHGLEGEDFEIRQYGGRVRIIPTQSQGSSVLNAAGTSSAPQTAGIDEDPVVQTSKPSEEPKKTSSKTLSSPTYKEEIRALNAIQFRPNNPWTATSLAERLIASRVGAQSDFINLQASIVLLNGLRHSGELLPAGQLIALDPSFIRNDRGRQPDIHQLKKAFKGVGEISEGVVTQRIRFIPVPENRPAVESKTTSTVIDLPSTTKVPDAVAPTPQAEPNISKPSVSFEDIQTALMPGAPGAQIKHSDNGVGFVDVSLEEASNIVRLQEQSDAAMETAEAAKQQFDQALRKNTFGVLGGTGTAEGRALIKANDDYVAAEKKLHEARANGQPHEMKAAAEEMAAQAKYAEDLSKQMSRKYGTRGKKLSADIQNQARKKQEAIAQQARAAAVAPPEGSTRAALNAPYEYFSKQQGAMRSGGFMMTAIALGNLILTAQQISQARGRQLDAQEAGNKSGAEAEQKIIDALNAQLNHQVAFMAVMTGIDTLLVFAQKWIPAGPGRAIAALIAGLPGILMLWNSDNPEDQNRVPGEVGMVSLDALLSGVAGPLGSFVSQYIREWWAHSNEKGPLTGEFTRMSKAIRAVDRNEPAAPNTSSPIIKYK